MTKLYLFLSMTSLAQSDLSGLVHSLGLSVTTLRTRRGLRDRSYQICNNSYTKFAIDGKFSIAMFGNFKHLAWLSWF